MFHNICDFIKDELNELDHKLSTGGRLSGQEIEYADKLTHIKKSLLTVDAMENPEEYGYYGDNGGNYSRGSYGAGRGRYARRDSQGRYAASRSYMDDGGMKDDLYDLMNKAPNDRVRRKLEELMAEMEK